MGFKPLDGGRDDIGINDANLQSQIDKINLQIGSLVSNTNNSVEPCTPTFAIAFQQSKKHRIRAQFCANVPPGTETLRTDIVRTQDRVDQTTFDANIISDTYELEEDQTNSGHVEYPYAPSLEGETQYDLIKFVSKDGNGKKVKVPSVAPTFNSTPLAQFTTPAAFGSPSSPSLALILVNALDPTTKDYDAFVVLRVYAPLSDGGAAQTYRQAQVDHVRSVVSRTGTSEVLHGDVSPLDETQLDQIDAASTPANRGYVDITVNGMRPGTAYTWDSNVAWSPVGKVKSGGAPVSFTSGGLVIAQPGIPELTSVSLTATVDGDIADPRSASVTLHFTQSTPPVALRRVKLFYKKSTAGSFGDDPFTRTLHKDDFHSAGGVYSITWTGIKIKPRHDWNFKVTIVGEGNSSGVAPTRDVTTTLDATALNDPSVPSLSQIISNTLDPSTKEHDSLTTFRLYAPLTDLGGAQSMREAQVEKAWIQLARTTTDGRRKEGGALNDVELDQLDSGSSPINRGYVDITVSLKVANYNWIANIIEGLGETHSSTPGSLITFKAGGLATASAGITELTSVSLSVNDTDPFDGKNALLSLNFTQPSIPVALRYCFIEVSTNGGSSYVQHGDNINLKHDIHHTTGAHVVPLRTIRTKKLTSHIFRVTIQAQGGATRQISLTATTPDSSGIENDTLTPNGGTTLTAPTVYYEPGKGINIDWDVDGLTQMTSHLFNSIRVGNSSETLFLNIPTKTTTASGTTSKKQIHKASHSLIAITRKKLRALFGPTAVLKVRYYITNSIGETGSNSSNLDLATINETMTETGLELDSTIPAKAYAFGLVQLLPGAGFLSSWNAYDSAQSSDIVGKEWRDGPGNSNTRIGSASSTKGLKWLKATHNIEIATNTFSLGGELCCRIPRRQIIAGETYALQFLMKTASSSYTLNQFTASLYDESNAADIDGTPITILTADNFILTTNYRAVGFVFEVDTAYVQGTSSNRRQWLRLKFGANPSQILYIDNVSMVNRAQSIPWCPSLEDSGIQVDVDITGDTGAGGVGSGGGGGNGGGGEGEGFGGGHGGLLEY